MRGIKHFSPSALNTFIQSPGKYCLKYLGGYRDPSTPAMWAGTAAEAGLERYLSGATEEDALAHCEVVYGEHVMHEGDAQPEDKIDDGSRLARAAAQGFIAHYADRNGGCAFHTQERVEVEVEGISIPIIGYTDFRWEGRNPHITDTKASGKMPSRPETISADHLRAMAFYNKATGLPVELLYAGTAKKDPVRPFRIPQDVLDTRWAELKEAARCVTRVLSTDLEDKQLMSLFPPFTTPYPVVWSQDAASAWYEATA